MIGPMRWQQEIRFSGVPNSQVKTKEGRSKTGTERDELMCEEEEEPK